MDDDFSHEARRLLQDYRDRQTDDKSSRRSSSRHHDEPEYSYKEVNAVLENVIYSNGSPGLAKQLIELGADVNFARKKSENVWKKISRKNQHDQRSDLLLRAVTFSQPQLVAVMVPHADQENLNSVLPNAIARGDLAILRVLLDHGADPAELHNEFEDAVLKRKTDLVATLAAGPKRPCLGCLSKGLATAVKMTSLDTVNQLVAAGADVNYDFGMALLRAVDAGRPDYVAALLSGAVPPHADTLDATLGRMLKLMGDRDPEEGSAIIEMCLRAGAAGPETERLLTKGYAEVVGRRQLRLLDVMLKSRKPAGPFEAQALAEAVKTEDPAIVVALLQCHPSSASMTAGVREAMRVDETGLRHEMLHLLVDAGARKACLSEALVQVVRWLITDRDYERATSEKTNMALFSLILDQGEADVDFNRGEALQLAVQASCTELVWSMVSKQPRPVTLGTALPLALQVRKPEDKEAMVEILLRHRVDEAVVNQALIDSVQGGQGNLPITSLLVGRANVNHNGGQAFSLAIHNIDIHTLRVLLTKTPNSESLMAAVNRALSLERDDRQTVFNDLSGHLPKQHLNAALRQVALEVDVDLFLTQHLLRDGADATLDDGACMSHAAINLNTDLLRILGKYSGRNEIVYTGALGSLVNTHRGWIAEECTELIDMLLRNGAAGVAVDRALADVVEELGGEESERALADHFFRVFLAAGADVNFEDGVAARSAARKGDAHMLRRLLQQPMMTETASRALSTVMTAGHDEHLVVDLLGVFLEKTSARADPDIAPSVDADGEAPRKPLPIFLCLDLYPTSVGILHRLLALGCDLEVTLPCHVYPDEASGEDQKEDATVLLWALAQANNKVSSLVISELIEFGADPSFASAELLATPLILGCKSSRRAIVHQLLSAGAKVSSKDKYGRSALFHAARAGDADVVDRLLQAKPSVNDGSLHVAARSFNAPIVEMLLKAGHDADYRSTKHDGRTALGEMALRGRIPKDIGRAEDAVDYLKANGADPMVKVDGKTVIFLALDNADPEPMTQLLLDRILWKTLNSEENVYQDGHHHYSPTMYLRKGVRKGETTPKLGQLLREHGAVDRYYASMEHLQPYDAVGLPVDIAEFEKLRRAREIRLQREEEEHEMGLRRETEQAQHRARVADLAHETRARHDDDRTQQRLRNRGLEHQQALDMALQTHGVQVAMHYREAAARAKTSWQAHQDGAAMKAQTRATDREHRLLTHLDTSTMRAETRAADLESKRLVQAQRLAAQAETKQLEGAVREAAHRQRLTHQQETDGQQAAESRRRLQLQAARNAMAIEHAAARREQKGLELEQTRGHRLLVDQATQERAEAKLAREQAREAHALDARRAKALQGREEMETAMGFMREAHGMGTAQQNGQRMNMMAQAALMSHAQGLDAARKERKMLATPTVEEVDE